MESKTKNKQDETTIYKMVKKAFPSVSVTNITELTEGFYNVAYNITLSDNREVILKIAPPTNITIMSYESKLMKTEVETMRLVKERTKVPVPTIYYYDDSQVICDADYFFMEKLNGVTYNLVRDSFSKEKQYNCEYKLGQLNKMINSISNDYFGVYSDTNYHSTDWCSTFLHMIESILDDAKRANTDLGVEYDAIYKLVLNHSDALKVVTRASLVHWDLWEGNVFLQEDQIIGLIDFERAMWADPLMEYYFRSHMSSEGYLDGYGNIPKDDSANIRKLLYDLYLYLILVTECDYRHYSDDWQRNWAKGLLSDSILKLSDYNNK